jgi:hypothetical protein
MDTEFVNEYIARLTTYVHELTNKNILLETKLSMAEKVSKRLQEQIDALESEASKPKK